MSFTVELDLEDVAAVVVFLLTIELHCLAAGNVVEARRSFTIATKLAFLSGSPFLQRYAAGAGAERAQFYPVQAEEVRA